MALKIINDQNTFRIEGENNSLTAKNYNSNFKSLLKSFVTLTVDLS